MPKQRQLLTPETVSALHAAEIREHDGPLRGRLQAVRLYGLGYPVPEIQTITGCSRTRLMGWYRRYQEGGLETLIDQRAGGNNRKLTAAQRADLRDMLRQYTPRSLFGPDAATPTGQFWTLADLRRGVTQWYGVTYDSPTSYYTLFAQCGFTAQRPDGVFKSRREVDVLAFEATAEKN
jgi:transposase